MSPPPYRSIPDLFFARVAATPDAPAFLHPEDGAWKSLSWRETRLARPRARLRAALSRHLRRRSRGDRVVHAPRVDPRGPRGRLRGRRHGDRLPRLDRGGHVLHPVRLARRDRLRRGRRAGPADPEPPRRAALPPQSRPVRRRRGAFRATRCPSSTSRLSAARGTPRIPAGSTRRPGPPGRPISRRSSTRPGPPAARRASSCPTTAGSSRSSRSARWASWGPSDLQFLWLPLSHVFGKVLRDARDRLRLSHGRRRPRGPHRGESRGGEAHVRLRRPAHLREGAREDPRAGARGREGEGRDLPVGARRRHEGRATPARRPAHRAPPRSAAARRGRPRLREGPRRVLAGASASSSVAASPSRRSSPGSSPRSASRSSRATASPSRRR